MQTESPEESVTAIYHLHVQIIGRGSGRSAVGAAAYRAAEKLKSLESAAYRSGETLRDEDAEIVHDYTRKKGVVHKEIILPDNAPQEYKDRQTLWRAVEAKERRHDARLAREIEVALQAEFDLQENIELLREYIKENFVDRGMIADLAIHHVRYDNPHAHIMLTTRHITPDGFGGKNRDWDKEAELIKWRESWAKINNRKFEEKGLDERIDHRTLEAQGIDRLPTIHLGHEAAALERKGVRTERGDYNREIKRHNEERTALKENPTPECGATDLTNDERAVPKEGAQKERCIDELHLIAKEIQLEKALQKIREAPKTAQYTETPLEPENEPAFISKLEKALKAEKAMQFVEKMQTSQDAAKTARHMNALKETYIALEEEKNPLIEQHNKIKSELPCLEYLAESMEEHIKNIDVLRGRMEQFREVRRGLRFVDWKQKKTTGEKIVQAAQELERAQSYFKNHFHIDPNQAKKEIERLQEKIRTKQEELYTKQVRVQIIQDKQTALELEYHTQKLLNEIRPDHEQVTQLLEQMSKPSKSEHERVLCERAGRRLEVISDFHFERAVEKLPQHQATRLTSLREQAKEQERLLRAETKQRSQTYQKSR